MKLLILTLSLVISKTSGFQIITIRDVINNYPKKISKQCSSESSNPIYVIRKFSKPFMTIPSFAITEMVSYGDFNDSIFNKRRNTYFWPKKINILPISPVKVRKICLGWKLTLVEEESLILENIQDFCYKLDIHNRVFYKWVPHNDKNNIRGLLSVEINHQKKIISVKEILLKPFLKPKDFELLVSDLNQMKLLKEYSTYEINLETISI